MAAGKTFADDLGGQAQISRTAATMQMRHMPIEVAVPTGLGIGGRRRRIGGRGCARVGTAFSTPETYRGH